MSRVWNQKAARFSRSRNAETRSYRVEYPGGTSTHRAASVEILSNVQVDLELEIDIAAILNQLGRAAAFNKGAKASGLGGLVIVRARNRKVIGETRKPIDHGKAWTLIDEAQS
jgi:hypothetical protein